MAEGLKKTRGKRLKEYHGTGNCDFNKGGDGNNQPVVVEKSKYAIGESHERDAGHFVPVPREKARQLEG
jgi:hypothetical protein